MFLTFLIAIIYSYIKEIPKKIGHFLLDTLLFLMKIYKLYLVIILLIPVFLPLYIANNDLFYQIPPHLIVYDVVFLFGFILYMFRIDEIKYREEQKKWEERYHYNLENNKVNYSNNNYNNYNRYKKPDLYNGLTIKDIQKKKKNIRKILEEKEMI